MQTTETSLNLTPEQREEWRRNFAAFESLAARYRAEEGLRVRIDSGDVSESLSELGINLPAGVAAKIVADSPDTVHFVLPPDPNTELSEGVLSTLAGGSTGGTAGSVGSIGSFATSTASSTVSTAGSAGSAGSAS